MPYFDYNATAPLALIARETWLRANDEQWQNPSSLYRDAAKARIRMDNARQHLGETLGAREDSIVFNSGATEGCHAIMAYLASLGNAGNWLAMNPTEHPAMIEAGRRWFGDRIRWLTTSPTGLIDLENLKSLLADRPGAVVVMAANNETGVIQPWLKIAEIARRSGVPYVCDASQWLGKLPAGGLAAADWVVGAGHKFGAPKGVGFVKLAADAKGFSAQPGGVQEHGHRGGTEDLPSIWAMTEALAEAEQTKVLWETDRLSWRENFENEISRAIPGTSIIGRGVDRLWNTVALRLPNGENHRWVTKLDKLGFQISTGSACATGKEGPSHVLTAMGLSSEEAKRVVRVSSGWDTTREDWAVLLEAFKKVAADFSANPGPTIAT